MKPNLNMERVSKSALIENVYLSFLIQIYGTIKPLLEIGYINLNRLKMALQSIINSNNIDNIDNLKNVFHNDYDYDTDVDLNYDFYVFNTISLYYTPLELNNVIHVNNNVHYLSLLHCNCRSLNLHINSIVQLNDSIQTQFDIIALTETWLNVNNKYNFNNFPNYNFIQNDRLHRKGGGTGFLI